MIMIIATLVVILGRGHRKFYPSNICLIVTAVSLLLPILLRIRM
jgi:hypothetical protein